MLRIHLFKTLRVIPDGGPPLDLGSVTTRSLFAYLALNRRPLDRRHLAFVFWPQTSETAARRNLRQYLHRLRIALAPAEHHSPLLLAAENTVQLSPSPAIWVDVDEFHDLISSPLASNGHQCLAQAIELYEGDLLEDLYEDWIAPERERLREAYLASLDRLARACRASGQWASAIAVAQRMLAADPLREKSHALLMALYCGQGDRARAMQQWKTCVQVLSDELGVEPLPETRALYEAMTSGRYQAERAAEDFSLRAVAPSPTQPSATRLPPSELAGRSREWPAHPPAPLIGRGAELAQLDKWFSFACQGRGRVVLVQGEPGSGKTRLIHEALQRAEDGGQQWTIFSSRGREFESMMPYHPLAESLRGALANIARPGEAPAPWLSVIAQLVPELNSLVGPLDRPAAADGLQDRYHLAEALAHFFLSQALHQPVVLIVDDAHWADLPTWEFLGYLARWCDQAALLVICVARLEDLPPEAARVVRTLARQDLLVTLDVQRLSSAETAELASRLGLVSDPILLRRLYEETAGNPFFVIETVRALSDARGAGGPWTIPTDPAGRRPAFAVPLSVRAVVEARLDQLDAASRQLLSTAAALNQPFRFEILEHVTGVSQSAALGALEDWLGRRLVYEVTARPGAIKASPTAAYQYQFDHELIRRIAYEQMSDPRRRWVHRRIAEVFEAEPEYAARDPAELAYHFEHSDTPARALPHLITAGQQALSVRSYHEARQFGLQAVGLLKDAPAAANRREGQIDLNLQLALAYSFTGEMERVLPILHETEALAESLGDRARLGKTYHQTAQVLWRQGRPGAAGEYARRALRLAEELGDTSLLGASLRMIGRVSIATSAFDDAISVLQRYIGLAPARQARPDLAVVQGYLGVALARVGAWSSALDAAESGVQCARQTLSSSTLAVAHMQLAFVHAERHDWSACLEVAQRSLPLCDRTGLSPHCFMLNVLAGHALCHQGEKAEGTTFIEQALTWASQADYRVFVQLPHLFLAETRLEQEARATSLEAGRQAIQQALDNARQALELSRASGDRWAEAVALRVQAEARQREPEPDWASVESDLVASRDLLRQVRARPDLARTYLSLRRLYDRAAQMPWAVDCHFRATSIFEELGMADELRAAQGAPVSITSHAHAPIGVVLKGPNG